MFKQMELLSMCKEHLIIKSHQKHCQELPSYCDLCFNKEWLWWLYLDVAFWLITHIAKVLVLLSLQIALVYHPKMKDNSLWLQHMFKCISQDIGARQILRTRHIGKKSLFFHGSAQLDKYQFKRCSHVRLLNSVIYCPFLENCMKLYSNKCT